MFTRRWVRYLALLFVCACLVALPLVLNANRPWRANIHSLRITAGSENGKRHQIAETLSRFSSEQELNLELVSCTGSREALDLVRTGQVDLALVQGGLYRGGFDELRQVAVLHVEPLHLLVKSDEASAGEFSLTEVSARLRRMTRPEVNVSSLGSGTNAIASQLLEFFGLQANRDFRPTHLAYDQLMAQQVEADELPFLIFTVSSVPSPLAKHMITVHNYRPVELPLADAFRIDWAAQQNEAFDREAVVSAEIPAYSYSLSPAVPSMPLRTIGTRVQLIAHKDVPAAAVERLNKAIYNSPFAFKTNPALNIQLLADAAEFPLHEGTSSYIQKRTPILNEHLIGLTEQVLAILGACFGVVIFVWQTVLVLRRRRRDRQFLSCVERVGQIERESLKFERDENMGLADLLHLQSELDNIKHDMVMQFQQGQIDGAETLSGFLIHINDANENLTRLILHEREPRKPHP